MRPGNTNKIKIRDIARKISAFLASLPTFEVLHTPDYNILFSHYAYPNLSGFVKGFYSKGKGI